MKLNSMDVLKEVPEMTVVPCVIHSMRKKLQHYQEKILNISTDDHNRYVTNSSLEQHLLENNNNNSNFVKRLFKLPVINKTQECSEFDMNDYDEMSVESYENFCKELSTKMTFENVACSSATEVVAPNLDGADNDKLRSDDSSFSDSLSKPDEHFQTCCTGVNDQNEVVGIARDAEEYVVSPQQDVTYDIRSDKECADDEVHSFDTSVTKSVNGSDYEFDTACGEHDNCDNLVRDAEQSSTLGIMNYPYKNISAASSKRYTDCRENSYQSSSSSSSSSSNSINRASNEVDIDCQEINNKDANITGYIESCLFQQTTIEPQDFNIDSCKHRTDIQLSSIPCSSLPNLTDEYYGEPDTGFNAQNNEYDDADSMRHAQEILISEDSLNQHYSCASNTNICVGYTGSNINSCDTSISDTSNISDDQFDSGCTVITASNYIEQTCITRGRECIATSKITCPYQNQNYDTCIDSDKNYSDTEIQSCDRSLTNSVNRSMGDVERYCKDISNCNKKVGIIKSSKEPLTSTIPADRSFSFSISSDNVNMHSDIHNNEQSDSRVKRMLLPPLKIRKTVSNRREWSQNSTVCSESTVVSSDCNVALQSVGVYKDRAKPLSLPPLKIKKSHSNKIRRKTTYRASSESYTQSASLMYDTSSAKNGIKEVTFDYKSSDYIIKEKSSVSSSHCTVEFGPSPKKKMKYVPESSEYYVDESLNVYNKHDLNMKSSVFPHVNRKSHISDAEAHGNHKTSSDKPLKLPPVLNKTNLCDEEFTMIDNERINTETAMYCGEHCVTSESYTEHITTFQATKSVDFVVTGTKKQTKISRIPVPAFSSATENVVKHSFENKSELLEHDVVNHSFMKSRLPVFNKNKRSLRRWCGKEKEVYNPFTSAERQMMELLGKDDKTKNTPSPVSSSSPNTNKSPLVPSSTPVVEKITSPVLVTSPKSAFIKFSPIEAADTSTENTTERSSPEHSLDTGSENKSAEEASNASTPLPDNSEQGSDKNKNPISLSSLSLCSTISIESIDSNKNCLRKGVSHSAKNDDKRNEVTPLKRSPSVSQSPRSGREFLRTKLKMEDLLYGTNMPVNKNEMFFGSPIDNYNQFQEVELHLNNGSSSDSSLHKSLSDAETLNAEQELLKSMTELLFMSTSSPPQSQSPSLKYTPSLISSSQPSEQDSGSRKQSKEEVEPLLYDQSPTIKFCPDSAYNSLNRKSPPDDMSATMEKDSNSSGSENSFPLVQLPSSARFCHECGAKYPVAAAKFCCQCGVKRLTI